MGECRFVKGMPFGFRKGNPPAGLNQLTNQAAAAHWIPLHHQRRTDKIWNENIRQFLKTLPQTSWVKLHFEDLLLKPEDSVKRLCSFLDVDFVPDMTSPFKERIKMKPGLGNPNFHTRSKIETGPVFAWLDRYEESLLEQQTLDLLLEIGIPREDRLRLLAQKQADNQPDKS